MHSLSRRDVTKMLAAAPGMALVAHGRASFGAPWSGWAQVPGGGATIGAPAAVKLDGGGGVLYVVVRGTDSRIYYNRLITSDGLTAWSGWRAIPGGGQTTSGPTVSAYEDHQGNNLVVFVRDTNNGIQYNRYSFARDAWTGWTAVPGRGLTPSAPAVAYLDSYMYVFVRDTNNGIQYNRTQPFVSTSWSGWTAVPGGGLTPSAPGAAFAVGSDGSFSLSVVVQGFDNRIWENVLADPLFNWSGWRLVSPGDQMTPSGPAVLTNSFSQAPPPVFARGFDNGIYYNLRGADGTPSGVWSQMPGGGQTPSSPAAAEVNSYRFVFMRGVDNLIYYSYYQR